jgi:ribosomal protein S27AE
MKIAEKHTQTYDLESQITELDISSNEFDDPEICPECGTRTITLDEDKCEEYCTRCGYVTRAASRYVAGEKINLPYGLIII